MWICAALPIKVKNKHEKAKSKRLELIVSYNSNYTYNSSAYLTKILLDANCVYQHRWSVDMTAIVCYVCCCLDAAAGIAHHLLPLGGSDDAANIYWWSEMWPSFQQFDVVLCLVRKQCICYVHHLAIDVVLVSFSNYNVVKPCHSHSWRQRIIISEDQFHVSS